mgnify:CR=1 FL=1
MDILNTLSLKSNRQIKINFDGGDLSSDAGLLLIKEFAAKTGFTRLIKKNFKPHSLYFFNQYIKTGICTYIAPYLSEKDSKKSIWISTFQMNNPGSVSLLSGLRKPQIRF